MKETGDNMTVRLNGGDWLAMTDMGDNMGYTFTDLIVLVITPIISMMVGMSQVHLVIVLADNMVMIDRLV